MSYYAYLPYTITLNSSVILTSQGGDPNSSSTFTYISGSSVRGSVAAKLGNPDTGTAIKTDFDDLVFGGKARYLNAYPLVNVDDRTLPIPVSLRMNKGVALGNQPINAVDLAAYGGCISADEKPEEGWPSEQLMPIGIDYISLCDADPTLVQPRRNSRIHHQRDRQKGRATEDNGAIFTFESLKGGQAFAGVIQLRGASEDELELVENRIRNVLKGTLLFGRSRRAAYGGMASIAFGEKRNREITGTGKEGLRPLSVGVTQNQQFRVLLTSPCIIRNPETGQVDPASLDGAFLERFKNKVKLCRKRWSFELVGGFNRKWGLEIPQILAVSAGSVLVFDATQPIAFKELLALEHEGLGERKDEGFGRFIFLDQPLSGISLSQHASKQEHPLHSGKRPPLVAEIESRMFKVVHARKIEEFAESVVSQASNCPTNSLLGRLRSMLRESQASEEVFTDKGLKKPLQILSEWLDENNAGCLKKTAMDQLKDCKITRYGSLHSWLKEVMDKNKLNEWLKLESMKRQCSLGEDVKISENHYELSIKLIDAVLAAMAIRNKLKEERNGN